MVKKSLLSIIQRLTAQNRFVTVIYIYMKSPILRAVLSHHMDVIIKMSESRAHLVYSDEQFIRKIETGKWGSLNLITVLDSISNRSAISTVTIPSSFSKLKPRKISV
ncbi:hypothetical protein ACJMK2_029829 [Sinanodonta woodiana]|uniref:Uncharacterized protein n=1 Tax=Sinanodonta woodiana TaxID=1069815 RepID=A0ABD3XB97_SINWO